MSNINYAAIDENFPVAGQDNDTQTFRDNFDTIKTALRNAFDEVTDLQDNTARTDQDNDFNDKVITRAVMQFNRDSVFDAGTIGSPYTIDYENGYYQIINFTPSIVDALTLGFQGFPNDLSNPEGVGKIVLECYCSTGTRTVLLDPSGGIIYKKNNWDMAWGTNSFTVDGDRLILEIWSYDSTATFYIKNVGKFT